MTSANNDGMDWIERAESLVEYHDEALEFVRRVGTQLPNDPLDAEAVCQLWTQADDLDETLCGLYDQMNERLLNGEGRIEVTRGADVAEGFGPEPALVYQCTWALEWCSDSNISIVLSIEPRSGALALAVAAARSEWAPLRVPLDEAQAKRELGLAYYRAATRGIAP
ncbi:MAG: hypothetical protein FI707_09565 [SAR202 cluster bacterium]|mgnify:CR=1 FL=1|jgi:hypothetical protein|nr:hypothetical protein [Chloroflexota bacterium]MDP6663193.1 hypothetical protein [SAR202 cluster bacterium]HAL49647.1 hypothetical protein [Dehalococcoidia bacterium]MDP6801067.1 hypothetical protein [SAR202 cluster bacterium]MQG58891.1 hypothetical protein [SAR202 cluster bacterium]|tara:strand:- start:5037 stop:5537 length:501 start_codon:yes stop_codon:yes gene_type:complete